MAFVRKEIFLGRHRPIIALAVIVLLAFIIMETRLVEALMSLVLAGVVPGTGIVLSPDTMLLAAAGAIWVLFGVLVIQALIMRSRRGRHAWSLAKISRGDIALDVGKRVVVQAAAATEIAATEVATALAPSSVSAARRPRLAAMRRLLRKLGRTLQRTRFAGVLIVRGLLISGKIAADVLGRGAAAAGRSFGAAIIGAAMFAVNAFLVLETSVYLIVRWIGAVVVDIWHWAEPYLWNFDEWLELRVRRAETWARRRMRQSARLNVWTARYREFLRLVRIVSFRLAFKPAPADTAPSKVKSVSTPVSAAEPTQPAARP